MSFSWHRQDRVVYLTSDLLTATGKVKHAFSTRRGGLEDGVGNNLDLGLKHCDPMRAEKLRRLFLGTIGISLNNLVAGQQNHGTKVQLVTSAPRGAFIWETGFPATDALITDQPQIALSVYTADCVPLLFLDPVQNAIAAAHAGWKGSIKGIAILTLRALQNHFGSRPEDVLVAIGPSIGPCCYEIDYRVLAPLKKRIAFWSELVHASRPGHHFLDLWTLNRKLLLLAGVTGEHIDIAGLCTYHRNEDFFSYRAEQSRAGSLMAVISL
ncbi:MAG TPA: peptidoglycan editing factor PgeF [bacterium]|nr:peptidoglycan editing factor PgeF [bacterium]